MIKTKVAMKIQSNGIGMWHLGTEKMMERH